MCRIFIFIFILFSFCYTDVKGQTTGCLVSNIVYTTTPRPGNYDASGSKTLLASGYCSWTPSTGTSCIVCFPNLNNGGQCNGMGRTSQAGIANTFTMVLCPLDIHIHLMVVLIGFFGHFYITSRPHSKLLTN